MKSVRVVLAVVALLALPFGSVAAQGRPKPKARPANAVADECKDQQAATLAGKIEAGQAAPYGLDKKCGDPVPPPAPPPPPPPAPPPAPPPPPPPPVPPPPPPPPPSGPPTGIHSARGVVYEDVDGSGAQDPFAGEMGLAGWEIQLFWDGQFVSSATSGADGSYVFSNLGNSDKAWWVCVIPQAGYVRTQPASGNACSGNGVVHFLNSPFMTWLQTDFGEMIQ
ncbi:MAG TPA: SdrD B-like domain-containing protein [Gemmatimonadales bacterium]|nr:SdrD B-like domain-containing protein [Gemmatimonadales bacterium]